MSNSNGVITQADGLLVEFRNTLTGSVVASTTAARTPRGTARLSKAGEWSLALPMTAYDPATMGIDQYVTVSADMPVGADVVLFRGRVDKVKQEFTKGIRWVRLSGPDQLGSEWGTTEILAEEIYDTVVERVAAVAREYWQGVGAPDNNASEFMPEANDGDTNTKAVLWLVDNDAGNFPEHLEDVAVEHIYLYVGHVAPFDEVHFDFDTGWVQDQVATLQAQQFLPATEWTWITLTGNTTVVSGKPLAQDGIVSFAKAEKEIPLTHAKANLYWVRFYHTGTRADLDGVLIREIKVRTAGPATNDIQQVMTKCAPAGWTLHTSSPTSTARKHQMAIVGENALRALVRLTEHSGENFALTNTTEIRWMASPISSGITAKEIIEEGDSATSCYITDLQRVQERREIVTRVYLEGSGDDPDAAVNLSYLQAGTYTLPSGYTIAGNILAHTYLEGVLGKQIQKRLKFPDIGALWGGTGGSPQAALELLKAGLAYLDIHKEHSEHFTATLTGINKTLAQFHPGMTMGVQSAIYDVDGEVVEEIDATLVIVDVTRSMDLAGNISYDVILGKQAEYVPAAAYLAAMKLLKDSDRDKHFQASSGLRLVQGGVITTGGGGGSGGGDGGGVDWVTFAEHLAETFDAHEIGTQIAAHAAEEDVHNIPAQIDADIAAHSAIDDAHHDPVTAIAPLTQSGQQLGLATGNGVEVSGGLLRARPTDIAGGGLYASSTQLHVYTGNGLQIESDIVKVKPSDIAGDGLGSSATQLSLSPSTLSADSTNAASGSGHTHAITATADAHATPNALLEAVEGHLKLRDLDVEFDAVVGQNAFVGEDLDVGDYITAQRIDAQDYVGSEQIIATQKVRVGPSNANAVMRANGDAATGTVRMRKAPELIEDASITLDGGGVCRFDWFMGQWATAVRGAAFIAHYNGSLGSSTGTNYTASGAVSYEDSPFGRALQLYGTLVNLLKNPSLETNMDYYGTDGTLTLARSTEWAYLGSQSLKWSDYVSGSANMYYTEGLALDVSSTYTWSAVVHRGNNGAVSSDQIRPLASWGTSNTGYVTDATYEDLGNGAWRISQTFTTGGTVSAGRVFAFQVQAAHTGETWYADAWELVKQPFAGPIFDGSTPGCSWSGTAHASTSIRPGLGLQYESQNPEDWTRLIFEQTEGSILAWVKLASITGANFRSILYLESGWGGPAISFALTPSGKPYVAGEGFEWTYEYAIPSGYVMLALTWSLAGEPLVYVNGERVFVDDDTGTWDGFQIVQGEFFWVGAGLNGALDSLVISTNELTAEEIKRIYDADAPVFGVNVGESRGFSATTPNGRMWADSRGIHFADNDGNETGWQYIGEDGKSFINNDVEELRVADGTILLNADGMEILAVDGAEDEVDVPTYNKFKFVNVAREVQSALFQHGNVLKLVSSPNDGGTTAGCFYRFISPLGTEIWFELIAQGTPQMRVRDDAGDVILSADTTQFEAAKAGLKWTAGALTYKNQSAAVVTAGHASADADWVTPTLLNSWVNYAGSPTKSTAGYRLMPDGTVALKGVLKSGSSATAVMFTLPAAYRPSETRRFAAAADSAVGIIEVTTGGNVSFVVGGSTTQSSLDGVRFPL